jgi:hypothetical protein
MAHSEDELLVSRQEVVSLLPIIRWRRLLIHFESIVGDIVESGDGRARSEDNDEVGRCLSG